MQTEEREAFAAAIGTGFVVAGTEVELRLVAVERYPEQLHAPRRAPFSLIFAGPATPVLRQATWLLEHAELGRREIFLVPIGPGPDGAMRYEAAFN